MKDSNKINKTDLLLFIITAQLAGVLSALFSGSGSGFYTRLARPPLSPPAWLFPVVWTILYTLMGISAYMIYSSKDDEEEKRKALTVYWVQLFVNFSWSIVFFRFRLLAASVAVIIALIVLIAGMIKMFKNIRPIAGNLNIPYLVWVLFAAYLNIAVAIIN